MKHFSLLAIILIGIVFLGCEKIDHNKPGNSDLIMGHWINPRILDTIYAYERSDSLLTQDYGFTFRQNNIFIERKNAGWCGTPPISYQDFEGTWERKGSIIEIDVPYWGGNSHYIWEIILLDDNSLRFSRLEETYQWSNRYYYSEIFTEQYLDIYGTWKLDNVSGGFSGGGHTNNLDYLAISEIGMYNFSLGGNVLEEGKIEIAEQTNETLRINFVPDAGSGIYMVDSEKYVLLGGVDSLTLIAPCCDRYNYHFLRDDSK